MAKRISIENIELGDSGAVSKDKINNNFEKASEALDIIDGEALKKSDTTTHLGSSNRKVPVESAVKEALSTKAGVESVSKLSAELANKADKSEIPFSMIYLGFDADNLSQLTSPTITNPTTGKVITLIRGHSIKVLDQLDENGNAYIYQYDGTDWNRTPYTTFPNDFVDTDEFWLTIAENELDNINLVLPERFRGEALNGAIISDERDKITIPTGSTGSNSYFQELFQDADILNILKQAYAYDNNCIYGIIKIKVNDTSIGNRVSAHFRNEFSTSLGNLIKRIKSGNFIYFIFNNTSNISSIQLFQLGVQFFNTAAMTSDFVFEHAGSTLFIYNNETYARLLQEKVAEKKIASTYTFGTPKIAGNAFRTFTGGLACVNMPTTVDGAIQTVYVRSSGPGAMNIGIGILDQNNYAIIRDRFSIDVSQGGNISDVSERNIRIKNDELLFIYLDNPNASPLFGANTTEDANVLYYNDTTANGALYQLASQYGGYMTLTWTVKAINSEYYATKSEIEDVNNSLDNINNEILQINSQLGIVPDYQGNKYELRVINGDIKAILLKFIKVLCIGNSITIHPILEDIWWGNWGMAATEQQYDYVHVIEKGLKVKDSTATVTPFNASVWERNMDINLDSLFGDYLQPDLDLIIFRFGENVSDIANLNQKFDDLVQYVVSKCPTAKFVITGVFWQNDEKDMAFNNVAAKYNMTFIRLSDLDNAENKQRIGNMVSGEDGQQHEITNLGVANHPNNAGMNKIANRILTPLGYETVE